MQCSGSQRLTLEYVKHISVVFRMYTRCTSSQVATQFRNQPNKQTNVSNKINGVHTTQFLWINFLFFFCVHNFQCCEFFRLCVRFSRFIEISRSSPIRNVWRLFNMRDEMNFSIRFCSHENTKMVNGWTVRQATEIMSWERKNVMIFIYIGFWIFIWNLHVTSAGIESKATVAHNVLHNFG